MAVNLPSYLEERKKLVDRALDNYLPAHDQYPPVIHEAMRYSVFAGGKRIRPILVLATAEIFGKDINKILPTACAFELIHTYSLIHDDLPSMDDDDFRRGMPTSHKKFGEAIAILAGDALFTFAINLIARNFSDNSIQQELLWKILDEITYAAGTLGMIGGQVVDIQSEGREISDEVLNYIHSHKTGHLIRACIRTGGILGNAPEKDLALLTVYGEKMGFAFQIVDDILDLEGDSIQMGKTRGSDLRKKKVTYPDFYNLEISKKKAAELVEEAKGALKPIGDSAEVLQLIADYILKRKN